MARPRKGLTKQSVPHTGSLAQRPKGSVLFCLLLQPPSQGNGVYGIGRAGDSYKRRGDGEVLGRLKGVPRVFCFRLWKEVSAVAAVAFLCQHIMTNFDMIHISFCKKLSITLQSCIVPSFFEVILIITHPFGLWWIWWCSPTSD